MAFWPHCSRRRRRCASGGECAAQREEGVGDREQLQAAQRETFGPREVLLLGGPIVGRVSDVPIYSFPFSPNLLIIIPHFRLKK
jgi:hypothetical protein